MEEEISNTSVKTLPNLKVLIVPVKDKGLVKPDFVSIISSSTADKIIFVCNPSCSEEIKPLLNQSVSKEHYNILEQPFKDTGYNYADKVLFERQKNEVNYLPLFQFLAYSTKDRYLFVELSEEQKLGDIIIIGLKWCKDFNVEKVLTIHPKSRVSNVSISKLFDGLREENSAVLGRNQNIKRRLSKSLSYFYKTILLSFASGYWKLTNVNTSAIGFSGGVLKRISLTSLRKGNGFLMDLLINLNIENCYVDELFVYDKSQEAPFNKGSIFMSLKILFMGFFRRLFFKYLFKDFHPLFLFYVLTLGLFIIAIGYLVKIILVSFSVTRVLNEMTILAFILFLIFAIHSLAFSMWMDINDNKKLNK